MNPNAPSSSMDAQDIIGKYGNVLNFVLVDADAAVAANYATILNLTHPMELVMASISFTNASTSGTLQIEKLTGTQAPGSGTALMTAVFSLSATANTVQTKTGREMNDGRVFKQGDRLALIDGGTLTNLKNLVLTMYFRPLGLGDFI